MKKKTFLKALELKAEEQKEFNKRLEKFLKKYEQELAKPNLLLKKIKK